MNDELIDLLTRLWEYMDDKMDISDDMTEDGFVIPNKEARFCWELREALEKLK